MPVEVVLRDVEHRGGASARSRDAVELEARQLQHPDLGQLPVAGDRAAASVSSIVGPMLPAMATRWPARSTSCAGHRGRRRLAVGAGDGQHLRARSRCSAFRSASARANRSSSPARRCRVSRAASSSGAMRSSAATGRGSSAPAARRRSAASSAPATNVALPARPAQRRQLRRRSRESHTRTARRSARTSAPSPGRSRPGPAPARGDR